MARPLASGLHPSPGHDPTRPGARPHDPGDEKPANTFAQPLQADSVGKPCSLKSLGNGSDTVPHEESRSLKSHKYILNFQGEGGYEEHEPWQGSILPQHSGRPGGSARWAAVESQSGDPHPRLSSLGPLGLAALVWVLAL